ncbi:hypothetical protein RA28_09720 [Ruegeria sp. ANG-S4]|uniref:OsmC family protein n=1 Tax=Ruegeria sp. ANG-S4 TaxID=1577904 RepID=UPI00057F5F38|nr:OsmC family protein [Ruegeria sp. ANG-S4]KIC45925.1 hypothetical protein RA28_09720 [Ruegeria sp. ANG-S4]
MEHEYASRVVWTGNRGTGTSAYKAYDRTWDIAVPDKEVVHCSNDPLLGGDPTKLNPEDLLLSSLSACHMLWYLHFSSAEGIAVSDYADSAIGIGAVAAGGAGSFKSAVLRPHIKVPEGTDLTLAAELHNKIHEVCFIARSVNFPVSYEPTFEVVSA